MRIFCAVRHSQSSAYYGSLWSDNFCPALEALGCQVIESKVDLLPASQFMQVAENFTPEELELRSTITQRIVEEVKQEHSKNPIDVFLSYFYNSHFDPSGFDEIHRLGIPTINFFCNSIYQFDLVAEIAPKVTYAWHPEKEARSLYQTIGANPIWVQMGANPQLYHPVPSTHRKSKACFIGQRYADRDRLLSTLIQHDIPVDIYGKGWGQPSSLPSPSTLKAQDLVTQSTDDTYLGRKQIKPGSLQSYLNLVAENISGQGLWGGLQRTRHQFFYRRHSQTLNSILATAARGYADSISQTFADYEVVLNCSNVWADGRPGSTLIPHVRLRDFEAPMCRTCYLTGHTEEIAEFYELDKEIETYASPDELVDKANYYLTHPDEAERLRNAGYQRASTDHTWTRRFQQLLSAIGLKT